MNILWLSHIVPFPPKAGVLQRCYNMLNEIAKYHDIDLLTFVQKSYFEQFFKNPQDGLTESVTELSKICRRVKLVQIDSESKKFGRTFLAIKSLFTRYPYSINWLKSRKYQAIISQWLREKNYDLVYFDTISLAPYLKDIHGLPSILDHHNIESHLLLRRAEQEKNPLRKYYYYQEGIRLEEYEKEHCKQFNMNITCSRLDSDRLLNIDPNIVTKEIANGVSLVDIDDLQEITTEKSIVFIGTLNWDPNTKAVIYLAEKIWPILKKKCPNVVCHIIGAHPPKLLVDLSKNDQDFNVYGFVSDLTNFLKPGTIFVCPIKDGGGTKLKILDALGMKAAVVADPIACEGINVTDNEDVLLASTEEEYVDKILMLFNDPGLRKALGENARALVESEYSYESIGLTFSNLCKNVSPV